MTVKYHESGVWIEKISDHYRIGLSEKGQDDIGEVMFVELPEEGTELKAGDVLLGVEGAKAVTELTIPINGTITAVHKEVEDEPELLNSAEQTDNWIVELASPDQDTVNTFSDKVWGNEN